MTTPGKATRDGIRGRTRLIDDTEAEIRRLLEDAARTTQATIAAQPSDYQRWVLPPLLAEIRRTLDATGAEAAAAADTGQVEAWRQGSHLIDDVVTATLPQAGSVSFAAVLPTLDNAQLRAMRGFLTEKIKGATLDATDKINTQLGLTMIGSQTPFEAVQAVTAILGEKTTRRATTIVRTELARAHSAAGAERMQQWAAELPGLQKRWLASGKRQPRLHHHVIHGQQQPVAEPFLLAGGSIRMMHPHDPKAPAAETINCGCLAVPVPPEGEDYGFQRTAPDSLRDREAEEARAAGAKVQAASAKLPGMFPAKPERAPWHADFPAVAIHADQSAVKQHARYQAAKGGDVGAAFDLVMDALSPAAIDALREAIGDAPVIVAGVQAIEGASTNVIPEVMARVLASTLERAIDDDLVQTNRVGHTGASGWHRLAHPALFDGIVQAGARYLLVDDFVGQGGTFANLRGHIERAGGTVVAATALTGRGDSAILALTPETLTKLRNKHGEDLEKWWQQEFGYGFDALTESEARYLLRAEDADRVRDRLAAAAEAGDS